MAQLLTWRTGHRSIVDGNRVIHIGGNYMNKLEVWTFTQEKGFTIKYSNRKTNVQTRHREKSKYVSAEPNYHNLRKTIKVKLFSIGPLLAFNSSTGDILPIPLLLINNLFRTQLTNTLI